MQSYSEFFNAIAGKRLLSFQQRFHEEQAQFRVLIVPTGLGKTMTVLVDWLFRRPTRRLAWVLPGRALTAQVAGVARDLARKASGGGQPVRVIELMGGSEDLDLTLGPDESAILVGTQDVLVSRALNRGYARSPFRWPIDFGLLNNDTSWVFDEVQLLGDALATSTQLAAFRARFGTFGQTPCTWLSATFDPSWLETVDFGQHKDEIGVVRIGVDDAQEYVARQRLEANKSLEQAPEKCRLPGGCAEFVRKQHEADSLSLVIANTVDRACEIWEELKDLDPVLLHSRFRPGDRERQLEQLKQGAGIVVSTQVVEAGMDLDARLLVTDVAPWASLVQRFGRANRYGNHPAKIYWVDRPLRKKSAKLASLAELDEKQQKQIAMPYDAGDVAVARETLAGLNSASPGDLRGFQGDPPYRFVLRKADLFDLFDTTPDLAGNHVDVSRFVRSGEESDVYLAWRDWSGNEPDLKRFEDSELCPVPLSEEVKKLLDSNECWVWRYAGRGKWEQIRSGQVAPGMRILLRSTAGCYLPLRGWAPGSKTPVPPVLVAAEEEEAADSDPSSFGARRQTLTEHTQEVIDAMKQLLEGLDDLGVNGHGEALLEAARKHDWGKAHPVFQQTLHGLQERPQESPAEILAKQDPGIGKRKHSQPHFRHELASALAMLQTGSGDLEAYLAAAHHGKVRMSIRSMPREKGKDGKRIARGVHEGDVLFQTDKLPGCELTLAPADLGRQTNEGERAWSDRVLALLEREGPFRLAYLETLLRAADERASQGKEAR